MIKVLFIEDEPDKESRVQNTLRKFENVDIKVVHSISSAILSLKTRGFDILLLDMSLPLFDSSSDSDASNEFESLGGLDVLAEVKRSKQCVKTIVLTAFDVLGTNETQITLEELDRKMKSEYSNVYVDIIFYNSSNTSWEAHLERVISDEINSSENRKKDGGAIK